MNKKTILFITTLLIIILSINNISAQTTDNTQNILTQLTQNYTHNNTNITLLSLPDHTPQNNTTNPTQEGKFNKSRPIYFAMDHTNAKDKQIRDTIVNRLESEGFNVVSAEIGPNKMSRNTLYLYEHNISNAIIFHLFNGVDPSTIRELAKNGNDNHGRIVRQHGNDVVLAWFYDSIDCVNENASGLAYIHGSETGSRLENPRDYMIENDIIAICTSSDRGQHKEDADYTGEKTVEEFIKLFNTE